MGERLGWGRVGGRVGAGVGVGVGVERAGVGVRVGVRKPELCWQHSIPTMHVGEAEFRGCAFRWMG